MAKMPEMLQDSEGNPSTSVVVAIIIGFVAVLASICVLFIWGDTEHSIELIVIVVGLASTTITGLIAALGSSKTAKATKQNSVQLQENSDKIQSMHDAVNGQLQAKITQAVGQSAKQGALAGVDAARKAIQDAEQKAWQEAYDKGMADARASFASQSQGKSGPAGPAVPVPARGPKAVTARVGKRVSQDDLQEAEAIDRDKRNGR